MRSMIFVLCLGSLASGQAMLEHAAAAGGGSVGGVAGKKVSDGLTTIFGKVDKQMGAAAKGATASSAAPSNAPLLEVGPGVPKQSSTAYPPPPPTLRHVVARKAAPIPMVRVTPLSIPRIDPPEASPVTRDDLRAVATGMHRDELLRLGSPSAKISMYEDGRLLEIYRYVSSGTNLGTVRLLDGSVSNVVVQ
jgi:hypothetical protein